jgi:uncharacterized protein HemX
MKRNDEVAGLTNQHGELEKLDPKLEEALSNFKSSVHMWSEAMVSRPRSAHEVVVRKVWKLAAGWALGGVLVAGAVSGSVIERHHQQEMARIAAAREAEHQRQVAAERALEEEELLARVDSDISRQVPRAMEPLASLMTDDETR